MKLPETPYYLMKQNKFDEAEKSLAYFRNVQDDLEVNDEYKIELETLKSQNGGEAVKVINESMEVTYKDFVTKPALKAMGIGIGLMVLNQGCGIFAMLNYTATIFIEGGSNMSPNMSAIVVGGIQLIGAYISTILVERSGRKFCLVISSFGTVIGFAVMGTYQYLKMIEYDLTQFSWIPVVSFSFIIFIASWGILTLPFVVLAEIMPEKIRASAVSIAMAIVWILGFVSIKYIYQLFESFGMHGASFIFAGVCFIGMLFIIFFVPETKGKSLEEIQQLLE
jgi:SP family facilitated glucose transporter-like MFS transporter 8